MSSIQSEAWTCPNGHFGNVMHGDAEDTWGDTECPTCGAEPGDELDPDLVTGDAPGLDDWINDHNPGCARCCDESADGSSDAKFVMPEDRAQGEKHLRWRCTVHGWLDNTGHVIPTGERVAA